MNVCVVIAQEINVFASMALRKLALLVAWTAPQNARFVLLGGQSTKTKQSVLVRAHICEFFIHEQYTNRFPVVCRERMQMCEWSRSNWSGMFRPRRQVVRVL